MNFILSCALSFTAMGAVDFCYAKYFFAAHERERFRSSLWAAVIIVLNSIVILNYVSDPWTIAAAALGAFVGTWTAVHHQGPKGP